MKWVETDGCSGDPCVAEQCCPVSSDGEEVWLCYRLLRRSDGRFDLEILQASETGDGGAEDCLLEDVAFSVEEAMQLFRLFGEGTVFPCNAAEVLEDLLSSPSLPTKL